MLCISCGVMREFLEVEDEKMDLLDPIRDKRFLAKLRLRQRNSTILRGSFKRVARIKADNLVR